MKEVAYVHLATKTCHRSFQEVGGISFGVLDNVGDAVQMPNSNCTCALEAICYSCRMDTTIQQRFTLL